MSSLRQSNLFAGEDFQLVYRTFKDVKFTAYDYDSIKETLINNIRTYYPEEFNDYVSSSEFIAIIDLIAFLSSAISFRNDLNSRQNILALADRKEAIINLARLISYQPKRAIPASGLFKIKSVRTTEQVSDSEGNNLFNVPVFWNDINNESWYDQFIQIINSVVNSSNTFGKPSKSGLVSGIQSELYQLNNVLGLEVSYAQSLLINGTSVPIEIVNPDFTNNMSFFEKRPDPQGPMSLIYRNDQLGFASQDTGFFLYFKQGVLAKQDVLISNPEANYLIDIDVPNINNDDVYVQEINEDGQVIDQWIKVPSVNGNNVIYNAIDKAQRNVFEVITKADNAIQIKFPDGTFGNVPKGIIRAWYRTSLDQNIIIRPKDAKGLSLSLPYIGKDNQEYVLTLTYDLEYTVSNSSVSESPESIKTLAPQSYYSQNRMVNNQDYNVFPLSASNQILKLKSTNRTYAGHSRYIDINDPTGFYKDLIVIAQDGALYKDDKDTLSIFNAIAEVQGSISLEDYLIGFMESRLLESKSIDTLYYTEIIEQIKQQSGNNTFDIANNLYWKTLPSLFKSSTGLFVDDTDLPVQIDEDFYPYLKKGSIITLKDENTNKLFNVGVRSLANYGIPYDVAFSSVGPINLSKDINDNYKLVSSLPPLRKIFEYNERLDMATKLQSLESFGLGYSVENDIWYVINNPDTAAEFIYSPTPNINNDSSWLIIFNYNPRVGNNVAFYEIVIRGLRIIFESADSVEFLWTKDENAYDPTTGKSLKDTISIISKVNVDANGDVLNDDVKWQISGEYVQPDGYVDARKVEVIPADEDEDGISDYPLSFYNLVNSNSLIVFSKDVDQYGFETENIVISEFNDLYVYDPVNDTYNTSYQEVTYDPFPGSTSSGLFKINNIPLNKPRLLNHYDQLVFFITLIDTLFFNLGPTRNQYLQDINKQLSNVVFRNTSLLIGDVDKFKKVSIEVSDSGYQVISYDFSKYFERVGIASKQNILSDEKELVFKWQHHSHENARIDPAISNIVDIIVLTESYMQEVMLWKNSRRTSLPPLEPTSQELSVQFAGLDQFKMISDQLIYKSGKFKFLFGAGADNELKASFKVIKLQGVNISDNEIKTRVVQSIEEYFAIDNWQFGETFYFTELSSFVHKQLVGLISSIVIVPQNQLSQFGDLFEVVAQSNEIFMSTATVDNIDIVSSYTESNLRM